MTALLTTLLGYPLLLLILKAILLFLAAFWGYSLSRGLAPAHRHQFLLAGVYALAALPLISTFMPAWEIPVIPEPRGEIAYPVVVAPADTAPTATATETVVAGPREYDVAEEGHALPFPKLTLERWIAIFWWSGSLFFLLKLVGELIAVVRLTRGARPARLPIGPGVAFTRQGLRRPPRVLVSDKVEIPMTWGVLRPVILLPSSAETWSGERCLAVLLHESAHIRRRDFLHNCIARSVHVLYWFVPGSWKIAHWVAIESEKAVDSRVVEAGLAAPDYAEHLLAITREIRGARPGAAVCMTGGHQLEQRLLRLLGRVRERNLCAISRTVSMVGSLALAFSVAVAMVTCARLDSRLTAAVQNLEDPDLMVRKQAIWQLATLEDDAATANLVELLADPDAEIRGLAAWALGEIKDTRALDPLVAALDEANPTTREMIVVAIGEHEVVSFAPEIIPLVADPESSVRAAVAFSLGEMVREDKRGFRRPVAEALTRLMKDPDPLVRRMAASAGQWLLSTDEDALVREGLTTLVTSDPDGAVRRWAVASLWRAGVDAVPLLTEGLSDELPAVREAAAIGLGRLEHPSALPALIQKVGDPDPEVRSAVVWALDELKME